VLTCPRSELSCTSKVHPRERCGYPRRRPIDTRLPGNTSAGLHLDSFYTTCFLAKQRWDMAALLHILPRQCTSSRPLLNSHESMARRILQCMAVVAVSQLLVTLLCAVTVEARNIPSRRVQPWVRGSHTLHVPLLSLSVKKAREVTPSQ